MPTIGRHRKGSSPRGDYAACCDICGTRYLRSELRKDGAGRLVCAMEGPGKDEVTLSRESARNSAGAAARAGTRRPSGGGSFDQSPTEAPPPFPGIDPLVGRVIS